MTITVARVNGRLVQVVRVAESVQFSPDPGWVLVCYDFEQPVRRQAQFKWMPVSTRFDWVRTFAF